MTLDITETMHQAVYGKTSKVNAKVNSNPDFQEGFAVGRGEAVDAMGPEWMDAYQSYGNPLSGDPRWEMWAEWKRGFWSGKFQSIEVGMVEQ